MGSSSGDNGDPLWSSWQFFHHKFDPGVKCGPSGEHPELLKDDVIVFTSAISGHLLPWGQI
jgi:hypothetical protein